MKYISNTNHVCRNSVDEVEDEMERALCMGEMRSICATLPHMDSEPQIVNEGSLLNIECSVAPGERGTLGQPRRSARLKGKLFYAWHTLTMSEPSSN